MELKVFFTVFAAVFIALRQSVRYSQKNKDCDCPQGGGNHELRRSTREVARGGSRTLKN